MYLILVIGGTQQGKTPFIKKYCKGKQLFVFDVQNEYGNKAKYSGQKTENLPDYTGKTKRERFTNLDVQEFIVACEKKKNTVCVFEEATMFFQGAIDREMRKLIFSKAHSGNVYILVFHSINSLPPRIMEASDYTVLFKTGDEDYRVAGKYPKLLPAFQKLQEMKDGSCLTIKTIQ